ncbi:unnamed protein product [Oikopleura dioica]|uniref:Ig-like domain-containing protein n=1 Tax=Oikopleura dioica TaxID=34765 RepID=E4X1I7_OIKDI|nr:unnamed protein product [Oikopleura dioica]
MLKILSSITLCHVFLTKSVKASNEKRLFYESGDQLSIICNFDGVYLDLRRVDENGRENTLLTITQNPFIVEEGWNIDKKTETTYVTIYIRPEIKLTSFGEIEIQEGSKARIATCSAENSNPAAEIQWRDRNGKIFEGKVENRSTAENGLSSVKNTLEVDASKSLLGASFECVVLHRSKAVSGAHSGQFSPALKITWKPTRPVISEIAPLLEDGEESADKKSFECSSSGSPEVDFSWRLFNPNKTAVDTSHWKVTGNRISTENVKLSDSGLNIECIAQNSLGRASSITLLEISTSWLALISSSRITMVVILIVSLTLLLCLTILLFRCAKNHRTVVYKTGTQAAAGKEAQV